MVGKSDTRSQLYDFASGKRLSHIDLTWICSESAFAADGSHVYLGGNFVIGFDRAALRSGGSINDYSLVVPGDPINHLWAVAVSHKNRWHATGGYDRNLYIRDQDNLGILNVLNGYASEIWCADFSPNGEWLVTGSERNGKGEVVCWKTSDWTEAWRLEIGSRLVSELDFHPTQPLLAISCFDGTIGLVDLNSGQTTSQLSGPSSRAMHVEFSRNGEYLAAARTSKGVSIWKTKELNLEQPTELQIPGDGDVIWGLTFANDDRWLATVNESGVATIYAFPSCEKLVNLRTSTRNLRKIAFTPDDEYLAISAYGERSGQIWNLRELRKTLQKLGLDW